MPRMDVATRGAAPRTARDAKLEQREALEAQAQQRVATRRRPEVGNEGCSAGGELGMSMRDVATRLFADP